MDEYVKGCRVNHQEKSQWASHAAHPQPCGFADLVSRSSSASAPRSAGRTSDGRTLTTSRCTPVSAHAATRASTLSASGSDTARPRSARRLASTRESKVGACNRRAGGEPISSTVSAAACARARRPLCAARPPARPLCAACSALSTETVGSALSRSQRAPRSRPPRRRRRRSRSPSARAPTRGCAACATTTPAMARAMAAASKAPAATRCSPKGQAWHAQQDGGALG